MFELTIKTNNAAFEEDIRGTCAEILRQVAHDLDYQEDGVIRDANGNQVGFWELHHD